jgi:hypothetical protein
MAVYNDSLSLYMNYELVPGAWCDVRLGGQESKKATGALVPGSGYGSGAVPTRS